MFSELRRRWVRTVLTALGLAVGVGLVVVVGALSTGLNRAQDQILHPLTGLGSDLSVTRPVDVAGGASITPEEQQQLEKENASAQVALKNLGKPGSHFVREVFAATSQLSFPGVDVGRIRRLPDVARASGGLILSVVHVSGKVPKGVPRKPGQPYTGSIQELTELNVTSSTVMGIDDRAGALGAIAPSQVTRGRWFGSGSSGLEALLNQSYATTHDLHVGATLKIVHSTFKVVGVVSPPLAGQEADVYVPLGQLQSISGRGSRVNTVYVRATSGSAVPTVTREIPQVVAGASVTTTADLAKRVGGSLVNAKNLTDKLGKALMIVGLAAAFAIAILLTLTSVSKRVRELGTLKALGWRRRHVVRQVSGEALVQGLIGGVLGVAIGIGVAAVIGSLAPKLEATVAPSAATQPTGFFSFGQGSIATGSAHVVLSAPVEAKLVLLAVLLAMAGGLLAGAVGGLRAARLRPADALRNIE